jgi:hypothetical protein
MLRGLALKAEGKAPDTGREQHDQISPVRACLHKISDSHLFFTE